MRKKRELAATGLFVLFVVTGGTAAGAARLVPDGAPRVAVVMLVGVAFVAIYLTLLVRRIRQILGGTPHLRRLALLILLDLGLLLAGFAAVYERLGVYDASRPTGPAVHDFWTGLYFSVVTFTTLGYGDFYPTSLGRPLAGLQALTGYLVLGVLASTAASVLAPHTPSGLSGDD